MELSAELGNVFYVPEGFAHGFVALEDNTLFLYKCSDYYTPAAEGGLRWDDPALGIDWQLAGRGAGVAQRCHSAHPGRAG